MNTGRDTHLSLFFVLMRNDNDAILQWPFSYRVIFTLIDQSTQEGHPQHVSEFFWPDSRSQCFQRPQSNMNVPYGFERFFPLDQLKQNQNRYVQNDEMFLKVEIDFMSDPHGKLCPRFMLTRQRKYPSTVIFSSANRFGFGDHAGER